MRQIIVSALLTENKNNADTLRPREEYQHYLI
jgi:hypothetical protein